MVKDMNGAVTLLAGHSKCTLVIALVGVAAMIAWCTGARGPAARAAGEVGAGGQPLDLTREQRAALTDPNLLANASFEKLLPAVRPEYPDGWCEERGTPQDRFELVTDPGAAHRGRRYLRVYAPGEVSIRIHNVPEKAIELVPGATYVIRLWARTTPGTEAMLAVQPGEGQAQLTAEWAEHRFTYQHPADAQPKLGMFLEVTGGPVDVDDVSMTPEGQEPLVFPELLADRTELTQMPVSPDWRVGEAEPLWQERVPVVVSEVMGHEATDVLVELELREVLPGVTWNYISPERLKVVDASGAEGGEEVPWALVEQQWYNLSRVKPPTLLDRLVFRVSCPPRSTKTYFVYLASRKPIRHEITLAEELPQSISQPSSYPYELDIDVGEPQKRVEVACTVKGNVLQAQVRAWPARSGRVRLHPPDGEKTLPVPLLPASGQPGLWTTPPNLKLPRKPGVWQLTVQLRENSGHTERAQATFLYGAALWAATNGEMICRWDPPRYGADRAQIAAARNEREAFQVVIDTTEGLRDVVVSATDLAHTQGQATIPAQQVAVERVQEVYLSRPLVGTKGYIGGYGYRPYPHRGGWYPDAILPWRKCDIPAGGRKVAWVTVKVPKDAPAGEYRGALIAECSGRELRLPIELKVFDFSLPDKLSFTPLLGADLWGRSGRDKANWFGGDEQRYTPQDREAVMGVVSFMAQYGATPFYYYQTKSPYPAPWRYHPETKTATFDFAEFDKNAELLLEQLGASFLFLTPEFRTGWASEGYIRDGGGDWETQHSARNNTPLALDMRRAWAAAMGAHLQEKGWIDQAYIYLSDEPYGPALPVTAQVAQAIKEGCPELRTFVAGSAIGEWHDYFQFVDAFSGQISPENWARFQVQGTQNWGVYNRPWLIGYPLSISRAIGLDSWLQGYSVYFHYAVLIWGHNRWLNPKHFFGGAPFVTGTEPEGLGYAVYVWPDDEPLPPGESRSFAASLRLAAMRESAEDYEYLKMLSEAAAEAGEESLAYHRYDALRARLESLLKQYNLGGDVHGSATHGILVVPPDELYALHRELGEAVEAAQH